MFKKCFWFIFCFFLSCFLSNKIEAKDLRYCDYNNTTLVLPVTIHVNIEAHHPFYPFSQKEPIYQELTYLIYDKETCENKLSFPYIDEEYEIYKTYYYQYNNKKYLSYEALNKGTYHDTDLTPPVFTSPSNEITTSVDKYITLDELNFYISAYDQVDGKIIPEVTYDNYSNNFNKIGKYTIIFTAVDKSNNYSNYNLTINVLDLTSPIIKGKNDFLFPLSKAPSINEILMNFQAYDNYDGDITHKIYSTNHNYNPKLVGDYYIVLMVKDSSNNELSSPFKVNITIYDDIAPTIEGPTKFTSYLSSIIEMKTILANMVVNDNYDKNVYKNLYIIDDTYSKNQTRLGEYNVVLGCYDENGNEAIPYIITIKVIDDVIPNITGTNTYHSLLSSPLTLLQIKSNILAIDNYDGNVINKLEIQEDNYTHSQNKIGVYTVIFFVKDSSLNESLPFIVEVIVIDDVAPIIEGENMYKTLVNKKINIKTLLLSLSAFDNVDGNISDNINLAEDDYSDNYNIPGTYFVTFNVSDSSFNSSINFKVKIVVEQELSLLQTLDNSYIYLDTSHKRTDTTLLETLGVNQNDYMYITTLENNYINNYNKEGIYKITFKFEDANYNKEYLTLNIVTYQDNTDIINTSAAQKKETIFQKIISFFNKLLSVVTTWFKQLFR